jgi:hypothetical protein
MNKSKQECMNGMQCLFGTVTYHVTPGRSCSVSRRTSSVVVLVSVIVMVDDADAAAEALLAFSLALAVAPAPDEDVDADVVVVVTPPVLLVVPIDMEPLLLPINSAMVTSR